MTLAGGAAAGSPQRSFAPSGVVSFHVPAMVAPWKALLLGAEAVSVAERASCSTVISRDPSEATVSSRILESHSVAGRGRIPTKLLSSHFIANAIGSRTGGGVRWTLTSVSDTSGFWYGHRVTCSVKTVSSVDW
jgi:hypothetical protein